MSGNPSSSSPSQGTAAPGSDVLQVSDVDIDLARMLLEMYALDGREVDPAIYAIANAKIGRVSSSGNSGALTSGRSTTETPSTEFELSDQPSQRGSRVSKVAPGSRRITQEKQNTMAPRKTERVVNLTIALLVARQYLPKNRIRELVEGYHGLSDAAFDRTFERDKDELRALGVPIEVGGQDPLFEDEAGYRILPSEFSLPPIELDAEEASVVGVAARVWQHASMAESTQSAMTKLRAAGVEPDPSALAALEPSVQATEPAFGPLWNAVLERIRVRFTYRDGSVRTLEPWGMTSRHGRWYVVGRDVDRNATRMFKLSRITDLPVAVSRAGAFDAPLGLDLRALASSLDPQEPTFEALLAVRPGKAPSLTRRGRLAENESNLASAPDGYIRWWVGSGSMSGTAEEVAGHGADVLALEPAELRDAVVSRLRAVAARTQVTAL